MIGRHDGMKNIFKLGASAFFFATLIFGSICTAGRAENGTDVGRFDAIERHVTRELPSLLTLYKHFHTHPELSFHEAESSARIAAELRALGFDVTEGVGGYGVVGVLRNGEGPTVLVRGDMDALPVAEETGLAYASEVKTKDDLGREVSVMHACGHDVHMTTLLGTSRVLAAMKEDWHGTFIALAQPAEERGAGARAMLADGLFDRFPRPDVCLALHVDSVLRPGIIGYVPGYAMANVDSVDILVRGRGGHGAYPEMTIDPVVIASRIVLTLQTIISREISPREPAVITVGSIHAGTKHNIIPDEARLQLTVRSYSEETRNQLLEGIRRVARAEALAAGVPPELEPIVEVKDEYTPATFNDPALVEHIVGVLSDLLGASNVVEGKPSMGGEDFGRYGREEPRIPIFMFRLGSLPDLAPGVKPPSLHSSLYHPDPEPTIRTGVKALSAATLDLLGGDFLEHSRE